MVQGQAVREQAGVEAGGVEARGVGAGGVEARGVGSGRRRGGLVRWQAAGGCADGAVQAAPRRPEAGGRRRGARHAAREGAFVPWQGSGRVGRRRGAASGAMPSLAEREHAGNQAWTRRLLGCCRAHVGGRMGTGGSSSLSARRKGLACGSLCGDWQSGGSCNLGGSPGRKRRGWGLVCCLS